jgi:hypothetical protein
MISPAAAIFSLPPVYSGHSIGERLNGPLCPVVMTLAPFD